MKKRTIKPTEAHQLFHRDITTVMSAHPNLTPVEYLCLMAQLVGQLAGLQDQTKYTSEAVMTMIAENIKEGNLMVQMQMINADMRKPN